MMRWTRDLGGGRFLTMESDPYGKYIASIGNVYGYGGTPETSLDALLAVLHRQEADVRDFYQSFEPGGVLRAKMQQISQLVDQIVAEARK